MSNAFRGVLFAALAGGGIALCGALLAKRANTPLGRTFAPVFALLGKGTKTADRALSRVLPLDDVDEATLGGAFAQEMQAQYGTHHPDHAYVNALVQDMAKGASKNFKYRAFVAPGPPNAFALPGGVVMVTDGLLAAMTSEAELASVIGHEIGHIELGHCFDSARFAMLGGKLANAATLGEIADTLYGILAQTTFGKTQESEADDYGYEAIIAHGYDPDAVSAAFSNMQKAYPPDPAGNPFRDYFSSHPPTELRIENFTERSRRWRARNSGATVYTGVRNYKERMTRTQTSYTAEEAVLP